MKKKVAISKLRPKAKNNPLNIPKKGRKPDPSKEHEARETPAQEKREHETGMEVQDEY